MASSNYWTQWAAQFFVAAELTRRGYLASFTLGNAPRTDLLVTSPKGVGFRVEVKGLKSRTYWIVHPTSADAHLFYVFVSLLKSDAARYFVLTSQEVRKLCSNQENKGRRRAKENGRPFDARWGGFNWGTVLAYEDKWDVFPD